MGLIAVAKEQSRYCPSAIGIILSESIVDYPFSCPNCIMRMQHTTTPMTDQSKCAVCIGGGIAAIGLYLTIVIPLIATDRLSYMTDFLPSLFRAFYLIVASVALLPYLSKLYLYYFYKPKIYILYFANSENINITNDSSKDVEIGVEFELPEPDKERMNKLLQEQGTYSVGVRSVKGLEIQLPSKQLRAFQLESPIIVRLLPKVHLSEFRIPLIGPLPRFYGDVELRPIERIIALDENGDLLESDEEWLEREYGTTEGIPKLTMKQS